jgi:hypothetical protein
MYFFHPPSFIDTVPEDSIRDVVKITRSWELPASLKMISGIDFIDATRVACIQDEIGTIFIFNTETGEVEKEIPFAPPGDYQGIAIMKDDAWVSTADGRLFEVSDYRSEKPVVKEYGTHLTIRHNAEGLCLDQKNKRLLVAIQGVDEGNNSYKGIYAFDLSVKRMGVNPPIKIDLKDSVFARQPGKKIQTVIQPSDINIHPITGDIYIIDGTRSQLLLLGESGAVKFLIGLNRENFNRPEGISFSPSGDLYIAEAGTKQEPGRLLRVNIIP